MKIQLEIRDVGKVFWPNETLRILLGFLTDLRLGQTDLVPSSNKVTKGTAWKSQA